LLILAGVGLYRLWCMPDLQPRSLAMLRMALIGHASAVVLILAFLLSRCGIGSISRHS
jgi:hypothetical protein